MADKVRINSLKVGDKFKYQECEAEIIVFEDMSEQMKKEFHGQKNKYIWFKTEGYRNAFNGDKYEGVQGNYEVELISSIGSLSSTAPRNNDGRTTCFWCKIPTQKRGGGMYDVCPKCSQ